MLGFLLGPVHLVAAATAAVTPAPPVAVEIKAVAPFGPPPPPRLMAIEACLPNGAAWPSGKTT